MALMEEKDSRFRNLERKAGIFVLVAGILIALSILFVGLRRDVFTPRFDVYFLTATGDNLNEGQSVKFKGFRIGRVTKVSLNEDGMVMVALTVNKDYNNFIREDSVAALAQEGLIGDYMIEIKGGGQGVPVKDGGVLTFERATSLADMAGDFKGQLEDIIDEVKKVASKLTDPDGHLLSTIANIRTLSDELLVTNRHLDELLVITRDSMGNVGSLADNLDANLVPEIQNTVSVAGALMVDLDKKINETLDNVISASNDLRGATAEIPGVVSDTREIMGSVKNVWPISSNMEQPEEKGVEIDSQK